LGGGFNRRAGAGGAPGHFEAGMVGKVVVNK